MKVILVGLGGTARELLRRLGEMWDVTVIDTSRERIAQAQEIRSAEGIVGDGSSRIVLTRAGLEAADAFVALTDDDQVNLEACRLAHEAGVGRVVAITNDPEGLVAFREREISAVSPDSLTARRIEQALESRRVSSAAFADGKVEVIEFRVESDTPVRGKTIHELQSPRWTVGAVLREDRFVELHAETTLETDDLVVVVGSGADFSEIVRTFSSGEARFPLGFGKRVAIAVEPGATLGSLAAEAAYLARNTRASSLLVVHRDPAAVHDEETARQLRGLLDRVDAAAEGVELRRRSVRQRPVRALSKLPAEESIGVLALPDSRGGILRRWLSARRAVSMAHKTRIPVLVCRGSHPYQRIVLPARRSPAGRAAASAAVDLARFVDVDLTAVHCLDLVFISGAEALAQAKAALEWLKGEAAYQGIRVNGSIRRGNPVKAFVRDLTPTDLLVVGVGRTPMGFWGTDVPSHLIHRSPCSVLLIPVVE